LLVNTYFPCDHWFWMLKNLQSYIIS
jgi:hypothetical protein